MALFLFSLLLFFLLSFKRRLVFFIFLFLILILVLIFVFVFVFIFSSGSGTSSNKLQFIQHCFNVGQVILAATTTTSSSLLRLFTAVPNYFISASYCFVSAVVSFNVEKGRSSNVLLPRQLNINMQMRRTIFVLFFSNQVLDRTRRHFFELFFQ